MRRSDACSTLLTFLDQIASCLLDRCSGIVARVLPVHDTTIPSVFGKSVRDILSKVLGADPSSIGSITLQDRLSNDNFLERDASVSNFLDSCSAEVRSCSVDEKLFEGIVPTIPLVVELNHVEINHMTNFLMNSFVGTI